MFIPCLSFVENSLQKYTQFLSWLAAILCWAAERARAKQDQARPELDFALLIALGSTRTGPRAQASHLHLCDNWATIHVENSKATVS